MNEVAFRQARRDESRTIAELYAISSDGVAQYIWSTLAEADEDLLDVGQRRYERPDSVFSYRSCTIAELDGRVAGMLVAFPMPGELDEALPEDPVLVPYAKLEQASSYYVCGIAFFPEYRGRGLGTRLMALAEQHARESGLDALSLVVFEQNAAAKRLYGRLGYEDARREPVHPHPLIHHTGDAVLMVKRLA